MIAPFANLPLAAAQRNFIGTPFISGNHSAHHSIFGGSNRPAHPRFSPGTGLGMQPPMDSVANAKIKAELDDKELWQNFNRIGTEMVITKNGRYVKNFNLKKFKLNEFELRNIEIKDEKLTQNILDECFRVSK